MSILIARDLKKYYGAEPNIVKALDDVSLEVEKGEFVAIVGTSGSGKSTLLHMLGGLDRPDSGTVIVDGTDISGLKEDPPGTVRRYAIVGNALAAIIMLIGILNFINTMVTSIVTRRRELAMMEAVGMTAGQQKSMLIWEGVYYAVFTAIVSLILSAAISEIALKQLAESFWMFTWHFTLAPVIVCIPILFVLVLIVPYASYAQAAQTSIVDRLRTAE